LKALPLTWGLPKYGLDQQTSASTLSQHLFRAGQTSPGSWTQLQILVLNSSSVPGRQLGNSRTSASPGTLGASVADDTTDIDRRTI